MSTGVEVVVVGAGIGGLAAAIVLAAQGREVRVLELAQSAGGKAGTASAKGLEFDTGPSLLTLPGVFEQLFALTGASMSERVSLRATGQFRYVFPDGHEFLVSESQAETLANVADALGPRARGELEGFLAYARGVWESAAPHFVFGDAPQDVSVSRLSASMLRALARIDAMSTMKSAISRRVADPRIQWLLWRYATYNGSDVRTAPATLNCIAHVELGLGGHGVEGGIGALIGALRRRAEELGVSFEFGTRVERILVENRRVVGLVTEAGETHHCQAAVCNLDPALVFTRLLDRRRAALPSPSMSGWTWVLEAERASGRDTHTVLFPSDYDAEFSDIFDDRSAPRDPTVYVCDQAQAHGRGTRERAPLFAMINAPAGTPAAGTQARLERLVQNRLESAGLVDSGAPVLWTRGPAGLAQQFPGSQGSIYGGASNTKLDAFKRPPNRVRSVQGLYLASGGAHPGGGMPLCALSGVAAARALLVDQGYPGADELRIDPVMTPWSPSAPSSAGQHPQSRSA